MKTLKTLIITGLLSLTSLTAQADIIAKVNKLTSSYCGDGSYDCIRITLKEIVSNPLGCDEAVILGKNHPDNLAAMTETRYNQIASMLLYAKSTDTQVTLYKSGADTTYDPIQQNEQYKLENCKRYIGVTIN